MEINEENCFAKYMKNYEKITQEFIAPVHNFKKLEKSPLTFNGSVSLDVNIL